MCCSSEDQGSAPSSHLEWLTAASNSRSGGNLMPSPGLQEYSHICGRHKNTRTQSYFKAPFDTNRELGEEAPEDSILNFVSILAV